MDNNVNLNMQIPDFCEHYKPWPPLWSLNLTDDFLFDVTTEDLEACKIIIELSLGINIKELAWKEGQKVIRNLPGKRGIRLDFYAVDDEGNVFNVEMQKRNEGNLPKRTRFYQGLVDAPLLKSGERGFDNLNPLYIVVICDFDLFGYEKYRYTFTNRCHEVTDLELGDAATKIFLNTDGRNKEDVEKNLVDFLSYVRNSTSDMLSPECDARLIDLHNKISRIKSSSEMEVTYMKMEERDRQIREEGVALGISQGISQGIALGQTAAIQSFINTHRNKGTDESEILTLLQEFFNLSKDEASALLNLPQS